MTGLSAAKEAMDLLRHTRRERKLPLPGRRPTFFGYVETYFGKAEVAAKKKGTLENERWILEQWKAHLGDVPIDRIETRHIAALRDKRLRAGSSNRIVNLDRLRLASFRDRRFATSSSPRAGNYCSPPSCKVRPDACAQGPLRCTTSPEAEEAASTVALRNRQAQPRRFRLLPLSCDPRHGG